MKNYINSWSLESDRSLLRILDDFSSTLLQRAEAAQDTLNDLIYRTRFVAVQVDSVVSDLNTLSTTQFVESRVSAENISDCDKPSVEHCNSNSTPSADLVRPAIENGLIAFGLLGSCDSSNFDTQFRDRPLPYIIGTEEYNRTRTAGLSSENDTIEFVERVERSAPVSLPDPTMSDDNRSSNSSELYGSESSCGLFPNVIRAPETASLSNSTGVESGDLFGENNPCSDVKSIDSRRETLTNSLNATLTSVIEKRKNTGTTVSLFASSVSDDEAGDLFGTDSTFVKQGSEQHGSSLQNVVANTETPAAVASNQATTFVDTSDDNDDELFKPVQGSSVCLNKPVATTTTLANVFANVDVSSTSKGRLPIVSGGLFEDSSSEDDADLFKVSEKNDPGPKPTTQGLFVTSSSKVTASEQTKVNKTTASLFSESETDDGLFGAKGEPSASKPTTHPEPKAVQPEIAAPRENRNVAEHVDDKKSSRTVKSLSLFSDDSESADSLFGESSKQNPAAPQFLARKTSSSDEASPVKKPPIAAKPKKTFTLQVSTDATKPEMPKSETSDVKPNSPDSKQTEKPQKPSGISKINPRILPGLDAALKKRFSEKGLSSPEKSPQSPEKQKTPQKPVVAKKPVTPSSTASPLPSPVSVFSPPLAANTPKEEILKDPWDQSANTVLTSLTKNRAVRPAGRRPPAKKRLPPTLVEAPFADKPDTADNPTIISTNAESTPTNDNTQEESDGKQRDSKLFDESSVKSSEEEINDDLFAAQDKPNERLSEEVAIKESASSSDLFDFEKESDVVSSAVIDKAPPKEVVEERKAKAKALFDDEDDDSEDLFGGAKKPVETKKTAPSKDTQPATSKKKSLFDDDDSDNDLFGGKK